MEHPRRRARFARVQYGLHVTEIILRRAKKNGPAPAERGRAHGKKLMLALRKTL